MSEHALWSQVRKAWAMLAGPRHVVDAGRPREPPGPAPLPVPPLRAEGFADEALPWLDAVYRFSLRLTRGDEAAADDVTQETFLRAHRFWHTFERGSNAKAWLFTICRHAYLQERRRAVRAGDEAAVPFDEEHVTARNAPVSAAADANLFHERLDEEVVAAIDSLPEPFRRVLVLSDLGDLQYHEIARVIEIPIGTVRSRLFRARRLLQDRLRAYATEAGIVSPRTSERDP
ncbi:MAG: sigma-70 family RNA polymerase sigma factor [Gemmatimonadales bacterium]